MWISKARPLIGSWLDRISILMHMAIVERAVPYSKGVLAAIDPMNDVVALQK